MRENTQACSEFTIARESATLTHVWQTLKGGGRGDLYIGEGIFIVDKRASGVPWGGGRC